ncbi:uncharacterized protein LOC134277529, partial [Saccostrea cucullata]|uniref:uncharacterized protein LOC134277529 n=1 Tax=Saccostrea cuccullata TaxID=36930 RepID=UPI002ED51797
MSKMKFGSFGYTVDTCPGNKTEYADSATRLGCGVDENGRSQYVCVPNNNRSSLVEFCYNITTTGLYTKGHCLKVFENGNLDQTSCVKFTHGCPSNHFFLSDLYKFPACHDINPKERCFNADPSCPNITFTKEPSTTAKTERSPPDKTLPTEAVVGITGGVIIGVIIAVLVVVFILKRWKRKSEKVYLEDDIEVLTEFIEKCGQYGKMETEDMKCF